MVDIDTIKLAPSGVSGGRMKRSVSTMTLPIETSPILTIPHEDPTKRNNPHELHWRTEGPKWTGNMDKAWGGKYAHMEGEVYCRYCGAVPCPLDHDEEKVKRLSDLGFVREVVTEKKELEENYKKLDESMQKLVSETQDWRNEKAALQDELRLADRRRQEWDFERRLMEAELNRLKAVNDKQLNKLADYRKDQQKIVALNRKLQLAEEENGKLNAEIKRLGELLVSEMDETERYRKDNKRLMGELEQQDDTIRALRAQLDEANEEKRDAEAKLATGEERMRKVEEEIKKILMELAVKQQDFEQRENLSATLIRELRDEVLGLKARLETSESYAHELQEQLTAHLHEIDKLRQKLGADKRFKMFVAIKRECNELKDQNEALLSRNHFAHAHSIPFLNAEGRVTSPTMMGGGVLPGRGTSPCLQLRRAKSATSFSSRERLYSHRKIRDALKLENL